MFKPKLFVVCLILALMLFVFVSISEASDFYHSVEVELDGAWNLDSSVQGESTQSNISLEGEGKAKIKAITATKSLHTWWDLF